MGGVGLEVRGYSVCMKKLHDAMQGGGKNNHPDEKTLRLIEQLHEPSGRVADSIVVRYRLWITINLIR